MRDKQPYSDEHIDEVLGALRRLWQKNRYFRLGQMISNMADCVDIFYFPDEDIISTVNELTQPMEEFEDED